MTTASGPLLIIREKIGHARIPMPSVLAISSGRRPIRSDSAPHTGMAMTMAIRPIVLDHRAWDGVRPAYFCVKVGIQARSGEYATVQKMLKPNPSAPSGAPEIA